MKININADAAVKYTNILEKMNRSALPAAVRGTLNGAAFDVKQNTMPAEANKEFVNRSPNFFKANSKVSKATGWEISEMKAIVGFSPTSSRGADLAVNELTQQEYGGEIKSRSFIAMAPARGGSSVKPVRPGNRLSRIRNLVDSSKMPGKSLKQQFIAAANKAGKGGFVLGNTPRKTVWKIESVGRGGIKKKAMFSYVENRSVRVEGTGFMRAASLESANKIDNLYIREAERQIQRLKNK